MDEAVDRPQPGGDRRRLADGEPRTRRELGEALERGGRGGRDAACASAHLMMYAELEGLVASGPRRGKQHTYVLLSDRAPDAPRSRATRRSPS